MHRTMKKQQLYAQDNANKKTVCTGYNKHNNCMHRTMKTQQLCAQDNENTTTVCTGQ